MDTPISGPWIRRLAFTHHRVPSFWAPRERQADVGCGSSRTKGKREHFILSLRTPAPQGLFLANVYQAACLVSTSEVEGGDFVLHTILQPLLSQNILTSPLLLLRRGGPGGSAFLSSFSLPISQPGAAACPVSSRDQHSPSRCSRHPPTAVSSSALSHATPELSWEGRPQAGS